MEENHISIHDVATHAPDASSLTKQLRDKIDIETNASSYLQSTGGWTPATICVWEEALCSKWVPFMKTVNRQNIGTTHLSLLMTVTL